MAGSRRSRMKFSVEWQTVGSLQRRLRNCLIGMGVEPYAYGSPEYVALETYLRWRARIDGRDTSGAPVEMAQPASDADLAQRPLWVKSRHLAVQSPCPLWVISGHMQCNRRCPLYPK